MQPVIDHIQITVRDLDAVIPFYDRLMELLGFDRRTRARIDAHDLDVVEYSHGGLAFAISSPRASVGDDPVHRRRPGSLHHLAFRAATRDEVDRVHRALVDLGAGIVAAPREYPEHVPAPYYALYFKDPEGIKYEVVCAGVEPC